MEEQQEAVLDPVAEDQVEQVQEEQISDKEMNFRALREELAQIKQEKERLESNFDQWKRELVRESRPAKAEPPQKRVLDSLEDDYAPTGAQLKAILAEQERSFRDEQSRKEAEYQLMMNEVVAKSRYSDYDEVVSTYGIPLIEKEPDLADAFLAAKNKPGYLYKIGKMAMNGQTKLQDSQTRQREQAKASVANAQKPRTISGEVSGAPKLSNIDYYESMSDEDFKKLMRKNLGEG